MEPDMSKPRSAMPAFVLLLAAAVLWSAGCANSGTRYAAVTPSAPAGSLALCRDIADAKASMQAITNGLIPPDLAKLQDGLQKTRASIDLMATSSERSGGASNPDVSRLVDDVNGLRSLLAASDLISVVPQLRSQIDTIGTDLRTLEANAGCK
jgi:hypothetical protein